MNLGDLVTEGRLTESLAIDQASTEEMLRLMNEQDKLVAQAVEQTIPRVALAVNRITERMRQGGRLFYVGAGTSGRLGILDASEIPPTFGTAPDLVQGLIAGGPEAILRAREGSEDSLELGAQEMRKRVGPLDSVVGIAASGRTPYTISAVQEARRMGCLTVAISNNPSSPLSAAAEIEISPMVGPEVIMGSTRLKAGTSQKLVLNMISTAVMIKLGKVYSNLMIDMRPSNLKLRLRAVRMVVLATGVNEETASSALDACSDVKTAIVSLLTGVDGARAARALDQAEGMVGKALQLAREA